MSNNRPHIKNLKSNSLLNGEARKPNPEDLEFGEIAINYATDKEAIFIKNDSHEIVTFQSANNSEREIEEIRDTIAENELVISSALNDLNERIIDEKSAREATDAEIIQNLGNEITNRVSSENVLRNDLTSLINNLSSQIPTADETTITIDNGNLKVKTYKGIDVDSNGLNVAIGNSLTTESGDIEVKPSNDTLIVDIDGVSVNVNSEGGIGYDSEGLYVETGNGLTIDSDSNNLILKTPSNSGLNVDSNGVSVKAYNGINIDSNGVSVKAYDNTVNVSSDGISVKLKDDTLKADAQGVYVNYGDGLYINADDTLAVKTGEGLTIDNTDVVLNPSTTDELGGIKVANEQNAISGYVIDPEQIETAQGWYVINSAGDIRTYEELEGHTEGYTQITDVPNYIVQTDVYSYLDDTTKAHLKSVHTYDGTDTNNGKDFGLKINTEDNTGFVTIPIATNSKEGLMKAGLGLTANSNGVSLKTASTTEIGGVAIHDVHQTLIYEYHPIIGYTDDDVVVISVEEYNALPQEEKELYWEVYGDWVEITEEQYNELPEEDKNNPAKVRITTDELTFNDGDGNFGVNINDVDNKAYVNVPIAGENNSKYGLVKVGVTDVVHGLNGIKINRNDRTLAVDYDENYFNLNNGGVSLTLKTSVIAQLKTYYDVILYMKVLSVDVSTGDITFDNTTLNFVTYNPNDYTVSQIIAGLVNGTITTKVIVDFSAVNSNLVAKFPRIWETTMNYTGMGDIFGIYNTIFPFLDNSLTPSTSPYIKLENVGVDAQGRFQASTKVLMNHSGWTV